VRWIAGSLKTNQGAAVLQALDLLDGDRLTVEQSRYARAFRDALRSRGEGQVLNRAEIIVSESQGDVEYDRRFHLEPEWVAVALVALVHAGEITLALAGRKIDAASLDQAASMGSAALARFTHIERPKDIPLAALTALFTLLELPVGLIRNPASHDRAVQELQARANAVLEQLVTTQAHVREGITCWNAAVIEGAECDEGVGRLGTYQRFLDGLRPINTAGKLKNFAATSEQVQAQAEAQITLAAIQALEAIVRELQPLTAYLLQARAVLPADDLST